MGDALLLGVLAAMALTLLVGLGLSIDQSKPQGSPVLMGRPIMECADGSWVDNRAAGACFGHDGLPNAAR